MAKDLVGGNYNVEMAPLSFTSDGREEIREAPLVYIPNLVRKLADVVASYRK